MSKQRPRKEARELPASVNSIDWDAHVQESIARGTFRTIHLDRSISDAPSRRWKARHAR